MKTVLNVTLFLCGCLTLTASPAIAQTAEYPFLNFVKQEAAQLRSGDEVPAELSAWQAERAELKQQLLQSWGGFPVKDCPLEPTIIRELKRDGYRVEVLTLQTLSGLLMTANLYVPQGDGPFPAVLCVHGHWRQGKLEAVMQSRCIGLAKLGFVVLMVDALGAGERGLEPAVGEYHGEMVAATLLPVGKPLSGLQVYENGRAVDYLQSRPEVDPQRIGITGASGGGNQTMYAGAFDERFGAVVPVCSVGNYQAYLGAACCMCEVVPGILQYAEEARVLGLVAPRALNIVSATKDSFQFSPESAKRSLTTTRPIFELYGKSDHLAHSIFESPHAYNQPMRERMYGWMSVHLKNEGDGSPIPEPDMKIEEPESLRCFPGDSRPEEWLTIPQLAYRYGQQQLADHITQRKSMTPAEWHDQHNQRRQTLETLLGGTVPRQPKTVSQVDEARDRIAGEYRSEPGVQVPYTVYVGERDDSLTVIVDLQPADDTASEQLAKAIQQAGGLVALIQPRATGTQVYPRDRVGRAVDHNTAEWSLWLGRPLIGQWTTDVRAALDLLEAQQLLPPTVRIVGHGPAGLVALVSGVVDERIDEVMMIETTTTFLTDQPYENQRLGTLIPHVVPRLGDIPQIAELLGDRKLTLIGGTDAQGSPLNITDVKAAYAGQQQAAILFKDRLTPAKIAEEMMH